MTRRTHQLVIAAIILAAMTSCSQDSSHSLESHSLAPSADVEISPEQRKALDDNEVTREEYEAGFRRFQGCMEEAGYPVSDPALVNDVYSYSFPDDARETAYSKCYPFEFQYVDAGWQLRPEVLENSEESKLIKACLESLGMDPAETHMERVDQFMALDISLEECK
ncbi:MAG: hypothetical protein QM606_10420 [Leucobacter sp.]